MRKSVKEGRGSAIISRLPHFYQSGDFDNLLYGFVEIFGRMSDAAEEDLLRVMRSHWVNTADNEGSQGFDAAKKGDLDKIFALFLENLGGTAQLRQVDRRDGDEGQQDDAVYRDRVKGLIAVLLNGASTVQGIRNIVAANLGIFGNSDEAEAARKQIQVVEFLSGAEGDDSDFEEIGLFGNFEVDNSENPVAASMVLRLRITDPTDFLATTGHMISQICIWDTRTDQPWAIYDGLLKKNDQLEFLVDGSIRLNTVKVAQRDRFATLPEGQTVKFRVDAEFMKGGEIFSGGRLTTDSEAAHDKPYPVFDYTIFTPDLRFEFNYNLNKLQPATFQVRINWDIPPYTQVLDDHPGDNTRMLIRYIVDKVKAAGVYSEILFVKSKELRETHEQTDRLAAWNFSPPSESIGMKEGSFNSGSQILPDPGGLHHDVDEHFLTSGVFDFTRFESLNRFL